MTASSTTQIFFNKILYGFGFGFGLTAAYSITNMLPLNSTRPPPPPPSPSFPLPLPQLPDPNNPNHFPIGLLGSLLIDQKSDNKKRYFS